MRVGIVGFSSNEFNKVKAREVIANLFDELNEKYGKDIEIVSGYTAIGIPLISYVEGAKRGFSTTGIASSKAHKYDVYPCNNVTIIGDKWGDESEEFLSRIDILYKFGGGKQSEAEFEAFNGPKEEFDIG